MPSGFYAGAERGEICRASFLGLASAPRKGGTAGARCRLFWWKLEGWCHPWAPGRGHGVPLFPGSGERVVRAEGVEPSRAVKLNGFSYRLRLSPPGRGVLKRTRQVCGLDYPFTFPRKIRGLGAARLVSTPSRLECSGRAWLGIAISGFPEFGQFCIAGFPGEHSNSLQVRCVCRFRHARMAGCVICLS